MTDTDIVKMSAKGQLVVPEDIRNQEHFQPGDRFMPVPVKDGVLFKRIKLPNIKREFAELAKELEAQFTKEKISPDVVNEAVQWARKR
jgi:bifunctional DNA-binding transcriptional regulator/antitoxin component of YhaV-PrlF toxin-antitoxin module